MNKIIFPFFDDHWKPSKILSFAVIDIHNNDWQIYNTTDRSDTPYWRFETKDIQPFLRQNHFIFDKKTLYKLYPNKIFNGLINVNSFLWHHNKDIIELDYSNYTVKPIGYFLNTVGEHLSRLSNLNTNRSISNNYNYLVKACALLDGYVHIGSEKITKTYDHYTATGRLRDSTGNTQSLKKEKRDRVKTHGVLVKLDMESFHLRILNNFVDDIIPRETRGHDWIAEEAGLEKDIKRKIFKSLYSEDFNAIDSEFFRSLKKVYKHIPSPLGKKENFNYIIQQYEVLLMSKIICNLNVDWLRFIYYLYDGIYLDCHPDRIKDLVELTKKKINLPFTLEVGKLEKRFY